MTARKISEGLGFLKPHAGLIAVGEYDAGFFQRVPDDVDGAGLQRFAGFETYDGAGRDSGDAGHISFGAELSP